MTIVRNDVHASRIVYGSFVAMTSLTGLSYLTETPKSPRRTTPVIQSVYCSTKPRFVPYCSSRRAIISASWPAPMELISSSTGSDGSRKVSPNVSTDSPNRITISDSSRFPIILNKSFNPLSEPSRRFAVRRASQTGAGFGQVRAALPETARQIFLLHRKKRSFRRSRSKAPQYIRRQTKQKPHRQFDTASLSNNSKI